MARLRPVRTRPPKLLAKAGKVTHVLTFEETTHLANFFKLLVEIDVRLPKTTKPKVKAKTKAEKCEIQKGKHSSVTEKPCCIKCPAICNASSPIMRDLCLHPFTRIFNGNKNNSMRCRNDRHHSFIPYI